MERKMKNIIDNLKNNRPQLRNPEVLKENVINRVRELEQPRKRMIFLNVIRWAAAVIIFIGISNLGYQEYNTRTAVMSLQIQQQQQVDIGNKSPVACADAIQEMISKLRKSSFNRINDQRYYLFSLADVAYLEEIESPYYSDVKAFVDVLQKYYPFEYQLLMEQGEANLSIKKLCNDYRICELLRR